MVQVLPSLRRHVLNRTARVSPLGGVAVRRIVQVPCRSNEGETMRSTGVAYVLWLPCFLGICGLHRFYVGKPISGVIWLFTLGLLGVGQLFDLLLIPGMVEAANLKMAVFGRGGIQNTNNIVVNVVNDNDNSERRPRRKTPSARRSADDDCDN